MDSQPGFKDADAKRIIERAAQIDAERGHELDAKALQEIAAEAGISRVAMDSALQEHTSSLQEHSQPDQTRLPWTKRHPTLLGGAAVVAALVFLLFVTLLSRL